MFAGDVTSVLQLACRSTQGLANARRQFLMAGGPGVAALVLPEVEEAVRLWIPCSISSGVSKDPRTQEVRRVLDILASIAVQDPTLNEEFARQGSHNTLRRVLQVDVDALSSEEDNDCVIELQDLAATALGTRSTRLAPFTRDELLTRLPLVFDIKADDRIESIWIQQVPSRQSAQADVGFVMWPSAVVLSRYLLANPSLIEGRSVLELGAGCGLTGLLAGKLGPHSVTLTDFNRRVLDNLRYNAAVNGLENCNVQGLDFYDQSGASDDGWLNLEHEKHAPVDVVVAADIICQPSDATGAANALHDTLVAGGTAYVVCADASHRFGVECLYDACRKVGLQIERTSVLDMDEGKLLDDPSLHQTAGYVDGMSLTMFVISKPVQ